MQAFRNAVWWVASTIATVAITIAVGVAITVGALLTGMAIFLGMVRRK
jgi:ABC-type lipoprotein release transport system permease subunit